MVLTSEQPNPALPRILPTPALGIVNSKVVMANGGTDQPGADTADTAEEYLNSTSAGSGPYVLESFSTTSETVIARNDAYVGPTPANFDRIVFRNSDGTTQAIDVQNGNADIVMDLASDQLSSLRNADGLTIDETASPTIFFLFANADASVSEVTSNPDFVEAVRYGLDYAGLLDLAGEGSVQAPGVIPDSFLGALSPDQAVVRDVDRAKAALARCDCADATVQLEYPSDLTVERARVRAARRAHRGQPRRGRHQDRAGARPGWRPRSRTTAPARSRWACGCGTRTTRTRRTTSCSVPGSSSACAPAGPRAPPPTSRRWLSRRPRRVDDAERAPLYQQFQQQLNESGPFFPLFQPEAAVVSVTDRVTGAAVPPVAHARRPPVSLPRDPRDER